MGNLLKYFYLPWARYIILIFVVGCFKIETAMAIALSSSPSSSTTFEPKSECPSAREYVTALSFLREQKVSLGSERSARDISERVAAGCAGAARRFIQVVKLLQKVGLTAKDTVETAVEFIDKTDETMEAFVIVFQNAYAKNGLDLDLQTSLNLAKELSLEFKSKPEFAKKDFETTAKFCLNSLSLPRPICAKLAGRIAKLSESTNIAAASYFVSAFEFLTDKAEVNLPTSEALALSEKIISQHPKGIENFKQAYKFSIAKEGLNLDKRKSIEFALKMAELKTAK